MIYMPQISKRRLDKNLEEKLIETLGLALDKLSKDETKLFLISLLTPTERLMLAKRLGIAMFLKQGITQSKIASMLCVTQETVARTNLLLQVKGKGYDIAFKKLLTDAFMKEFKKVFVKFAEYSIRASTGYVKL